MEQKGRLTLRLTSVERGTCVDLVVEDSGPGIAEEIQERLFTPYVTTKGSRGTGLGLALVHRIVAEHGGSIEVGTAEDGGAAFQIRLPIEGPPDPPEQTQPPTAVD
jgi:two-component system sensor histidine kinase HydH